MRPRILVWLQNVNALVMQQRADKNPGEWKHKPNQPAALTSSCRNSSSVVLREGFERIRALPHPLAQAIMTMFVVAEVHPFSDGNGRTARLAMNCMLSAHTLSRIIIPDGLSRRLPSALEGAEHNHIADPLISALTRVQRWSATFDYSLPRAAIARIARAHGMHFRRICAATIAFSGDEQAS